MTTVLSIWAERFRRDIQPMPGRLNGSLRIVLASVIALLFFMTLRMPFASVGMYFVFLVGRDSPAVSVRSGFISLLALVASVAAVLGVVILTDNDPMARVLSVAIVTFVAGMLMLASTVPTLASIWGFIFCTLIAVWETHAPADALVKTVLYILGTVSLAVVSVVAVEYVFGTRHPAEELQQQRIERYQALETMFALYAQGADAEQLAPAITRVSQLAATGQSGMQRLYNTIVERNLETGHLSIGTRVRITMLAQLMDISAAFAWQYSAITDPVLQQHCAHIAELCSYLVAGTVPPDRQPELMTERPIGPDPLLIERIDGVLHNLFSMPVTAGSAADGQLVALPSSKVPLLISGALRRPQTIAFALKLSLCATLCYIIYQAVDWPGISTAVTTVLITGLSTSAAIKQKLVFRFVGSFIGGVILGLGATVYLFPHMDSITSLVVLIAGVAFLSAWVAAGRQFNYVGLQIAFAFYLVAFEGFSAPTELAPARDRLIGILLALVIMAFVFDLIWPVRTVTAMRDSLATVLRDSAQLLRLPQTARNRVELVHLADGLRDQIGKTLAAIRTMNDTIDYEFGVDRPKHIHAGETILRASLVSVAFFWNQLVVLYSEHDSDFLNEPALAQLRSGEADALDAMARSVLHKADFLFLHPESLIDPSLLSHPRYNEYVRNSIARFDELQNIVGQLQRQP